MQYKTVNIKITKPKDKNTVEGKAIELSNKVKSKINNLLEDNMNGKIVSLICKLAGIVFSIASIIIYVNVAKSGVNSDVVISLAIAGLIIANMALPVDISKIIINLKGKKNETN